jgi:hypothetical protein
VITQTARKRWTAIGCFGLILVVLIGASYFVPLYEDICDQSEQTGAKECAPYHLVTYTLWHLFKALDAASVAITALATFAIAWFTLTLRRSTDRLWKAGDDQMALTREMSIRQMRAYVSLEASPDKPAVYDGKAFAVVLKAVNRGQTPAYKLRALARVCILPHPFEGMLPRRKEKVRNASASILGPGQEFSVPASLLNITPIEGIRLNSGWRFHIWGALYYQDAFKKRRVTRFRVTLPVQNGGIPGIEFAAKGNEAT